MWRNGFFFFLHNQWPAYKSINTPIFYPPHIYISYDLSLMQFSCEFHVPLSSFLIVYSLSPQLEQHKIYSHVLTNEYAARVGNFFSYQAVRYAEEHAIRHVIILCAVGSVSSIY